MRKSVFSFLGLVSFLLPLTVLSQTTQDVRKLLYHERLSSAVNMLHSLIKSDPNNAEAWYLLTFAYLRQNKLNEIKDSLQKAPQAVLDNPLTRCAYGHILLRQNKPGEAKQNFDLSLNQTKEKDPAVLSEIAMAYIDTKAADANYAIEMLNKAIKKDKRSPELYVLLGEAYDKLGNGSGAYTYYKKALEIDPGYAEASFRLGKIFTSQKNTLYLQYFTDALKADSLFAPAIYEIYNHYYYRDESKAMEYLKKYIAASDYTVENDYRLTDMLYLNGDYQEAVNDGKLLIREAGDSVSPRIYKLIAKSYEKLNDLEDARNFMQEYLVKNKDTTFLVPDYETMAEIYDSTRGGADSAVYYYILAVEKMEKDSSRFQSYKKIAGIFGKKHDYENQAVWLKKYYTGNRKASNLDLFNCGIAYYFAGQYMVADSVFGLYINKYPEEGYGYYWRARSNVAIDTAMEKGLAVPYYLKVIELAEKDTTNDLNRKRLIESYGYIASYKANHDKDYAGSLEYFEKVVRLQPDNEDAKKYVAILQKRVTKGSN